MKKLNLKSLSILIPFAFFIVCFISCSSPVKKELLNYINEDLSKIGNQESDAIATYESVTGANAKDDETTYNVIKNDVIPKYKKFIESLESISSNLKTEEVKKVHRIYLEGANTQFSAFSILLSALEKQDKAVLEEANEKLAKGRKLISEYQDALKTLLDKNNIEIKK